MDSTTVALIVSAALGLLGINFGPTAVKKWLDSRKSKQAQVPGLAKPEGLSLDQAMTMIASLRKYAQAHQIACDEELGAILKKTMEAAEKERRAVIFETPTPAPK